ncbi:hypothetical protein SANA_20720 [Gottschalkiaceae bacterium SANA]|nr:hypothetical protein SANA_20720 [Gottschalkiaceae bacterium SANA]
MKKIERILPIIILLIAILGLMGCEEDTGDKERQNFIESLRDDEMVIVVWEQAYQQYVASVETGAAYDLMNNEGVSIRYLQVKAEDPQAYYELVNDLLYQNESVDLIHLPFGSPYQAYVDNGIAMNLTESIPEIANLYPNMQNPYYIPATIYIHPTALNRIELERLGMQEIDSLDRDGYMAIREAWLDSTPRYYTKRRYQEEIADFHTRFSVFDLENRQVSLAKADVVSYVEDLRDEIHSDQYLGILEEDQDDFVVAVAEQINGLNSRQLGWTSTQDIADVVFFPPVFEADQALLTDGYVVNRFGKNKEIAIRFLRKYMGNENQISIYEDQYSFYPTNQGVKEQICELEAFVLRNEKLQKLQVEITQNMEDGQYASPSYQSFEYWLMMRGLYERLEELIYDEDRYTREDLKVELKALEERLYLIMIE